jgi:thiol-disulfide isomerase/thioredoxin
MFRPPSGIATLLVAALAAGGCAPRGAPAPAAAVLPDSLRPVLVPVTAAQVLARAGDGTAAVTVVNIWATWCGPCREEFPAMRAAVAAAGDQARLLLVSADFDDEQPAVRGFLRAHGIRDTSFLKMQADQPFIDALHSAWSGALPATLVLDRAGRMRDFWEGGADSARFAAGITRALEPTGGPGS